MSLYKSQTRKSNLKWSLTSVLQRASPSIFSIHSVMALVIGWKLMSPISPLCLCHHLVSKSQQEFHSKKCDSVIANLNIPKICSSQSHYREVSVSNGARHNSKCFLAYKIFEKSYFLNLILFPNTSYRNGIKYVY